MNIINLNKIIKKLFVLILIACTLCSINTKCRSKLRASEAKKPRIELTREKNPRRTYFISSNYLGEEEIFNTFDKDFFNKTILPKDKIIYRYDESKSVTGEILGQKLENLFHEIDKHKKKYKDFKILKEDDFNRRKKCGLLIVKFNDYPFVAKVFLETPKTFVKPYSKGLYPLFFWNMNGGCGRFYVGFTRIKNLQNLKEKIEKDPEWSNRITFPRKWHWTPKNQKNIRIIGKNFRRDGSELETIIPGRYCVIADEIKLKDKSFSIFNKEEREECMSLCNFLDTYIDPHITNFLLEQDSDKIALIDTENFRALLGLKKKHEFSGYTDWIYQMGLKAIQDIFFKPKHRRK